MEAELATAHTVQDTLFPKNDALLNNLSIYGKSVPASECGGDWWHYSKIGDKVYLWIGGATGHGVPAALLTSAARAVASVIEGIDNVTPGEALTILNKAIYSTSKGQMMMTFFIACFDTKKQTMTYSNASHDPPFMVSHEVQGAPKRRDYNPLMDINNSRLGEVPTTTYKNHTIPFREGDKIVFYTDGVIDVKSPEGDSYGERRFIRSLKAINELGPAGTIDNAFNEMNQYRVDTPLDDDVTLVMVEFEKDKAA